MIDNTSYPVKLGPKQNEQLELYTQRLSVIETEITIGNRTLKGIKENIVVGTQEYNELLSKLESTRAELQQEKLEETLTAIREAESLSAERLLDICRKEELQAEREATISNKEMEQKVKDIEIARRIDLLDTFTSKITALISETTWK